MPRRSILTGAQRADLLALPEDEATLVRHWTLSGEDLRIIVSRRRPHNRLGFAIQLCGLRYPGRLLRPGEVIRHAPLAFVGEQLGIAPEALADYAARGPTRYEQLDTLRDVFGFQPFSRPVRAELQAWLLPPALTTTNGAALARLLLDELRRRRIIVPGITPVERMVGKALLDAERHVGDLLTRNLTVMQRDQLDALLDRHDRAPASALAWVRQPPGKPGRRAFTAILERLAILRAIDLDPGLVTAIHPERLRRLSQEGARLTAQHLATLNPVRRRAVLVATAIETQVTLTDDAVLMFERLFGQLFRRAERREEAALKRDRRTINTKIRLLARLGEAVMTAHDGGTDPLAAIESVIGWDALATEVEEARRLVRPDPLDPVELSRSNAPILRQIGPAFIAAFTFGAVPACAPLARAVAVMRDLGSGRLMAGYGLQLWPILQDMHQLRANYGERAGTFMSNAGVIQAFGVNDHATADMLSRTIGDTTLEYDTVSTSRGIGWGDNRAGPSESVSAHVTARRLATPDEIMRMRPDQVLLLRQGEHPLAVEKIRYYDQREFAGMFDPA